MYKVSQFTVVEPLADYKTLIYNMLTQSYFVIDSEHSTNWYNVVDQEVLRRGKFIVDQELDEGEYLLSQFRRINSCKDTLDIVLTITTCCEMRCVYCYEEGIAAQVMNKKTLESTINWINQYVKRNAINKVHVLLFGGEPVYNIDHLKQIVRGIAEGVDIPVVFSLASNGYKLNQEIVQWLIKYGLAGVQIPLDGTREIHDFRRPLRKDGNALPNFDVIIHNILNLVDLPLEVCIKINIDKHNIDHTEALLELLAASELQNKVIIKFEAIALTPSSQTSQCHFCKTYAFESRSSEMAVAYHDCMRIAHEKGFVVSPTVGNITPCMYSAEHKYVVDCSGELYKCISAVGIPQFRIGSVTSFNENSEAYNIAVRRIDLAIRCLEQGCPYVPKCGGGCAYESYLKDKNISGIDCKKAYFREYYLQKFTLKYRRNRA